jgi:hypothetical protein
MEYQDIESVLNELTDNRADYSIEQDLIPQSPSGFAVPSSIKTMMESVMGHHQTYYSIDELLDQASNMELQSSLPLESFNLDITQSGNSQNEEFDLTAMMELDSQLGPQTNPKEFKHLPNYSKPKSSRPKRSKIKKAYVELSDDLNALMAQANMLYIQGNDDDAIQKFQQVIQQRPDAHEAWF